MSKLTLGTIYGAIIGFTSTLFMGFVFYNEAFLHHGVLFIEPNLYVATLEFLMIVVGAPLMGFLLAALIFGGNGSARNEPDEDAMPAPGEAPKRLWN